MTLTIKNRFALYFLAVTVLVLLGLYLVIKTFGLRLNLSDSMPMGLYVVDKNTRITRGALVEVCLSSDILSEGIAKGYIDQKGICPDGAGSIIKEVIALPVDHVSLTNSKIVVNKTAYSAPVHDLSLSGIAITRFVKSGDSQVYGYWLYGSNNTDYSWDSRYFGAVQASNIIHVLRPLWVWSDGNNTSKISNTSSHAMVLTRDSYAA